MYKPAHDQTDCTPLCVPRDTQRGGGAFSCPSGLPANPTRGNDDEERDQASPLQAGRQGPTSDCRRTVHHQSHANYLLEARGRWCWPAVGLGESGTDQVLGQKGPDGADEAEEGEENEQKPGDEAFPSGDVPAEQLEVEGDGKDDGDEGAEGGAEEGTDRVEGREEDGYGEENEDDDEADGGTLGVPCDGGTAVGAVQRGEGMMDAAEDVAGRDEGTSVEGDLGEGYDGDEDAHEDGQGLGKADGAEDVGGDGVVDTVAEHEDPDDGEACVEEVLDGVFGQGMKGEKKFANEDDNAPPTPHPKGGRVNWLKTGCVFRGEDARRAPEQHTEKEKVTLTAESHLWG